MPCSCRNKICEKQTEAEKPHLNEFQTFIYTISNAIRFRIGTTDCYQTSQPLLASNPERCRRGTFVCVCWASALSSIEKEVPSIHLTRTGLRLLPDVCLFFAFCALSRIASHSGGRRFCYQRIPIAKLSHCQRADRTEPKWFRHGLPPLGVRRQFWKVA